jgi:hypothetical protein
MLLLVLQASIARLFKAWTASLFVCTYHNGVLNNSLCLFFCSLFKRVVLVTACRGWFRGSAVHGASLTVLLRRPDLPGPRSDRDALTLNSHDTLHGGQTPRKLSR